MEDLINAIGAPLVAVLVPVAVAFIKKAISNIPPVVLPILAGVIGPAAALLLDRLGAIEADGWVVVLIGVAGVGIREIVDQVKKLLAP